MLYNLIATKNPQESEIIFMREHLAEAIEGLFYQFVEKLYEIGEIKFRNLFVDGTKIEAYANKYTFVWKKAVEKNLAKLNKKFEDILPAKKYGEKFRYETAQKGKTAIKK